MRKPTARTALVTHKGCLDGTGCAAVFLWTGGLRKNIIFKPPSDCTLRPEEVAEFDEVWFADLCPSTLDDPAGGLPFWVCDHHLSNQKRCENDHRCTFSMTHSGTSLLARETGLLEPTSDDDRSYAKELIQALEDYDLGRFDNWKGQRLADAAGTLSQEDMLDLFVINGFGVWHSDEVTYRAMGAAGARTLYAQKAAESALYFEFKPPGWGQASGYADAGISIAPEPWKNAVAREILKRAELAIIVDSTSWTLSFRSDILDCSSMAQKFGGGGHKVAAGFKIASHDILRAIAEEIFG